MQNMMCAIRIVVAPSGICRLTNSVSSDDPITTSGVAIGMKISTLVVDRPRKRCRAIANATSVPRIVATIVASSPIRRLSPSESHMPGGTARVRPGVEWRTAATCSCSGRSAC